MFKKTEPLLSRSLRLFHLNTYLPLPDLFLVGSTSLYVLPGLVVGGKGSPFVVVTSRPLAPRGPISRYCPEFGAVWPGRNPLFFVMVYPSKL
jgi:hypothetical protein